MITDKGYLAIIEDDPVMGESLQQSLELEGWRTSWFRTGQSAVEGIAARQPDLVICDMRLPDFGGEEIYRSLSTGPQPPPFIFMTAFAQVEQAIALVRAGAEDYLEKPFEVSKLFDRARAILAGRALPVGNGVLGVSKQICQIEVLLRRIAGRSLPVLLIGETGTGKEVCARFVHDVSPRSAEPFIAVNCAAIPSELLESEVFGHEKGAFSGAYQRHLGYAERARGGTLFLDEIAEMAPALQTKMLRVLEELTFHRVGGENSVPLKARIVCATSENLVEQVRVGRFREDLLYRINAVTVEVPPLRQRPEDIPWLLARFFSAAAQDGDCALRGISSLTEESALAHPWRGNVRELRNRVERGVALAVGPWLMPADLFPELRDRMVESVDPMLPLAAVRDAAERRQIVHVLRETKGQLGEAAKRLDVSRTTLWEKMRRHGLVAGEAVEE